MILPTSRLSGPETLFISSLIPSFLFPIPSLRISSPFSHRRLLFLSFSRIIDPVKDFSSFNGLVGQ